MATLRSVRDPGRESVIRRRRGDRTLKLVAALAGACLVGFVTFVVVRGPSRTSGPSTAALAVAPPPVLKTGTQAPDFTLPALGGGAPVSLSAHRGRPLVVNFFASWCSECRAELDAVATVARSAGKQIGVVGVDSNESSEATASRLLAQAGAAYPVAVDSDATVATRYEVQALPVSYFLDGSGKVVGAAVGPQTVASLQRWVRRLEAGS